MFSGEVVVDLETYNLKEIKIPNSTAKALIANVAIANINGGGQEGTTVDMVSTIETHLDSVVQSDISRLDLFVELHEFLYYSSLQKFDLLDTMDASPLMALFKCVIKSLLLWHDIRNLTIGIHKSWLVGGNVNVVSSVSKYLSSANQNFGAISDFNEAMNDCGFSPLPLSRVHQDRVV
ncbi:hypothetical protein ACH5RR_033751 [Cinchona calisaya]|uniref:Uncharacterized protein n=1 Tax=Cinchona calisaya TaxID=153742 RepID=A0ABD2YCG7_9GENT